MKNTFFSYWTAIFFAVLTLNFNFNQVTFAGDKSPVLRAEKIPLINRVGRAVLGPKEEKVKTPHMDDLAKNPPSVTRASRYPCCNPSCVHPRKPPLITAEVPPPPPLLTAEVPPPIPLLVAEVPPAPTPPALIVAEVPPSPGLIVAEVPPARGMEFIIAEVPPAPGMELISADVPPPNVVVNYIELPPNCPPGTYPVTEEEYRRIQHDCPLGHEVCTCHEHDRVVYGNQFVQNDFVEVAPSARPVYWQQGPQPVPVHQDCFGGHGFQNQGPWFQNGGNPGWVQPQFVPQQQGGGNYNRAMAWGHHVADQGYGVGYDIGVSSYDAGQHWL